MPKKTGIVFVIAGAVLMLSALLLFFHNTWEDRNAGRQAETVLEKMQSMIVGQMAEAEFGAMTGSKPATGDRAEGTTEDTAGDAIDTDFGMTVDEDLPSTEMMVVEIDGYGYIGYLSIPALKLSLPVMSDWDYDRLKIAPCRQFGSANTDDLVIAGHNYDTFFAELGSLQPGDAVTFTDMDGRSNAYVVINVAMLSPTAVEAVKDSGHDLVLYTCNDSASARIVAFCDRTEGKHE